MKKVFIAGGASFNSVIQLDEFPEARPQTIQKCKFVETVGSTGIGKSLNFSKLGFSTTLHAFIGNDQYGKKIRDYLEKEEINFIYNIDPNGTERHVNLMNNHGERISIFVNKVSFSPNIDVSKFENLIIEADYVVLNIVNYTKELIPVCQKHKKEIWTDLHDYDGKNTFHSDYIAASDYILMSSINMEDYKGLMKSLIDEGKKIVICTHGKIGSTALTATGEWIDVPIIEKYQMVDTNGAGDSFFAGFLYGHSKGYSIEKSMKYGTLCAGLSIISSELAYEDLNENLLEQEYKKYYE